MNIGIRLAWRNLWRHSRRTWLTVGAMVFSNILLVFLISLQYAMHDMMVDNSLRILSGHIQVQQQAFFDKPRIENSFIADSELLKAIENLPGVFGLALRSEAFALASSTERSYGMQIIGVQAEKESQISSLPGLIKKGSYLRERSEAEIVIGSVLANNLKTNIGDELTIFGSARDGSTAAAILTVVGIFQSGVADLDRLLGQISLEQFDSIFGMEKETHRLIIVADNVNDSLMLAESVAALEQLPDSVSVLDWDTLQPELKQAIKSDMASSWFMYVVLIILVAFSVLNTQLMAVLERTKEYGIMMALGLSSWRLGKLVLVETFLMASLGLLIGVGLGVCLVLYLQQTGFTYPGMEEMSAKFNLPSTIYPGITFYSALLGPGLVFCISVIAALYPALRLHKLKIVQAMRAP